MIDAGTMMNLPARGPASPAGDRGAERGNGRDRASGQAVSQAAREHGGIRRAAEAAGHDRPSDFLATLRAQLRDGVVVEDPDGEAGAGELDGEDAALLDELIDLEVVADPDAAVGYGATLLGLIEAHAELDAAGQAALSDALAEAGLAEAELVDGEELDAGALADVLAEAGLADGEVLDTDELTDALAEAGLVDGEELTDALAEAGLVDGEELTDAADAAVIDEELLDADAEVDEAAGTETPADAGEDAADTPADTPAADAPPPTDDETSADEEPELSVASTEASAATRSARSDAERGETRGAEQARPLTPPDRHGRSEQVRADHLAPGNERSARPEFTRAATEAEAFRFATTAAPSAEANVEVAQATLRAAARMSALPPQVQRILDAAQRLENLPPPRQLTLELGEVRVRVAMDDGGLRLSVLSGDSDVGDDLLREARDLLEQQGFDLARDGDGEAGGDEPAGSARGSSDQDASRARRARRGGLRL